MDETYNAFLAEADQNDITKDQFRKLMGRLRAERAANSSVVDRAIASIADTNDTADVDMDDFDKEHEIITKDLEPEAACETPTKKFKCDQCPWSTTQNSRLTIDQHMKGHEKKYKCEQCDYVSSRQDMFQRHRDGVHNQGDNKFKCENCPYSSAEKFNLESHTKKSHGYERFM